jgi:FdhD protein
MHSKYKVNKFKSDTHEEKDDLISIEEPLEISLKFEKDNQNNYSIIINYYENARTR